MSPAPLYFSHRDCLHHDPREHSPGHPDTPERLIALEAALAEGDWLGWERRPAPRIEERLLELAHSAEHVRAMRVQLEVLLDGIPRDDAARERLVRKPLPDGSRTTQ